MRFSHGRSGVASTDRQLAALQKYPFTWQHIKHKSIPIIAALSTLLCGMVVHHITWQHTKNRCHLVATAGKVMEEPFTEEVTAPKRTKAQPKAKKKLNSRQLDTLKPEAKPYEVMDTEVRGLGIRIMPSGVKTFILFRRFPGSKHPARRSLGTYGNITLAEAREKAREWNALVKKGIDPGIEENRQRQALIEAEKLRQTSTFGAAFEEYLRRKASKLKSGRIIEREMSREFKDWMNRTLADISPSMVKETIQGMVERGAPTNAHFLLAVLRAFFNWVVDSGDFNLHVSPCAKLKPTVLIGPRNVRARVLRDYEIAAYWRAAEAMGYPFGKFFQLLLLTALRRDEAANARWGEIDNAAKLWEIPRERMKGGSAHALPLTPEISSLLESLPRFSGGDFLFSTTGGQKPISGFSRAKARLDGLMGTELEALGMPFEDFIIHDIRRTCRTRFSALPVEDIVRELLVAHARPGLHRVYDLHLYEKEKAHALDLWHSRLKEIIERNWGKNP
jgi:integrase